MTIQEAQKTVDNWIKTYGVRYFSELTNMACLTEEVGELARVMARKYGDQSFKAGENQDPAEEMADVLWVLLCLANQTGVNLEEAKQLQEQNGGFIKTMWCGSLECEMAMKEKAGMSSRCIPFAQEKLDTVCACCGKPADKMIYWGIAY